MGHESQIPDEEKPELVGLVNRLITSYEKVMNLILVGNISKENKRCELIVTPE